MPVQLETYRGVAYPWFCDSMGHMNTQHYCAMFDTATFHFLTTLESFTTLKSAGLGWADRKQVITYESELLAGALVVVETSPLRAGRSSVGYMHMMKNVETGVLHATCENTTVLFDLTERRSVPLTARILSVFEGQLAS